MTRLMLCLLAACAAPQVAKLAAIGDHKPLRERAKVARQSSPDKSPILYIALDGVDRDLLYKLLRQGKLPHFAELLGGSKLDHAYFEENMLSTLPSSTMAAWVTTLTGVGPAEHGVTGNEFFVRETKRFECPAPVSFSDAAPTLQMYTEGYLDKLNAAPNVYERMREKEADILIWVAMHYLYSGADTLLLAKKTVVTRAFDGFLEVQLTELTDNTSRRWFKDMDEGVVSRVVSDLKTGDVPDVLTVYLSGTDLYAHVAQEGPDEAREKYLVEVVDPLAKQLFNALKERNAIANRWVVVSADHGHTAVLQDAAHALGTTKGEDPPAVLQRSGFRVRPFKQEVAENDPFNAVFAYGGAMAYVYLAPRSGCPGETDVCNFKLPPRYQEDVLAAAEAFHRNNKDGSLVPALKGVLDMILVRKPKPYAEVDNPFEVYVGYGKTQPVDEWLKEHPHPTYVNVQQRLNDLAVGVHGERAGDILLLAHNGDRDGPDSRYYFASPYRSWHGSPSKKDSQIPFIVANQKHGKAEIEALVSRLIGERAAQQRIANVLFGLRQQH